MFRLVVMLIALMAILTPTLLCAMPAPSMTPSEQDCCAHMKGECNEANMTSCCTPVTSKVAIASPASVAKLSLPSVAMQDYDVIRIEDVGQTGPFSSSPLGPLTSIPPGALNASLIQVLRI